jgi:hypothetical protein
MSDPVQQIDFDDLAPIEVAFNLPPAYGGRYVLREASGSAAIKWRSCQMKGLTLDKATNQMTFGQSGIAESEAVLLSECLYHADKQGKVKTLNNGDYDPRQLVSQKLIQSWPNRIMKRMYDELMRISPSLKEAEETVGSLDKQIAELHAKREALMNGQEDPYPNGQDDSTDGSI